MPPPGNTPRPRRCARMRTCAKWPASASGMPRRNSGRVTFPTWSKCYWPTWRATNGVTNTSGTWTCGSGGLRRTSPGRIDEVQTRPGDDWLGGLRSHSRHGQGKDISGRTHNNYRNAVVESFNYAQTHDYLPKGIPTAAQATKTVEEITRENEVLSQIGRASSR